MLDHKEVRASFNQWRSMVSMEVKKEIKEESVASRNVSSFLQSGVKVEKPDFKDDRSAMLFYYQNPPETVSAATVQAKAAEAP